jgi:cephalosporin-C deacetylase-like acetyl esterase
MRLNLTVALVFAGTLAGQPVFTPYHASGIYELGEKAGWKVTVGDAAGSYEYVVRKNNSEEIQRGKLDFSKGYATIEAALDEPAMLYVEVTDPSAAKSVPVHLGAAIAPAKLKPAVPRPADFDRFWAGKLNMLREIPINPVLTPVETQAEANRAGVELYTVRLDSVGSHVQGYLAKPAKEGKFPALVIYQYAGVYKLQPNTVTDRAAEGWLTLDVDSHDTLPTEATAPANYPSVGNTDRETSYFLNMYLRDTRALDYISSRPDWDGKTIVIMGTSMGGQQSLVTAGLNPDRITAVIVNEPSGADSNGNLHGRKAGYPNWPSIDPKVMETALYFDTVNFASRIKAPVLAGIGFIDTTAPPVGIWTAMNQIPGPKEVVSMVESDHNNRTPQKQGEYVARSKEVLGILLHGGEFKPR